MKALHLKRWLAGITVFTFTVTSFSFQPAFAAPVPAIDPHPAGLSFPSDPQKIELPKNLGRIESSFIGKQDRLVLVVQDAHAIPEAQRSIEKIIEHFQDKYGLNLIGLEGASSQLDPRIFTSFPDKEMLKKVFQGYYEKGELTGSVAAAIFGQKPAVFQGVENWDLYEKGLTLYLDAVKDQPGLLEKLSIREKELNEKKQASYAPELLEIDKALNGFYKNNADLPAILKLLAEHLKPAAGSEMALMVEELSRKDAEVSLDQEVKGLAEQFGKQLAAAAAGSKKQLEKEYQQKLQEFQTSRTSAQAFALWMKESAAREGFAVKTSGRLAAQMGKHQKLRDIEGTKFFRDFEQYAENVKKRYLKTPEQVNLNKETKRLEILRKLIQLELSREEWEKLLAGISSPKAGIEKILGVRQEEVQAQINFYENASERDHAFFENLSKISKPNEQPALLVAGGFHAYGLTERLKAEGISYLLILPEISAVPEKTGYQDQMQGNVSWKDYFEVENGRVNLYKAFVRGTRDKLLGIQKDEKIEDAPAASSRVLKYWRDEIIRNLADQKQIEKAGDYTRFLDELVSGKDSFSEEFNPVAKIDRFIDGLKNLKLTNGVTEQNIMNLAKTVTHPGLAASPDILTQGAWARVDSVPAARRRQTVSPAAAKTQTSRAENRTPTPEQFDIAPGRHPFPVSLKFGARGFSLEERSRLEASGTITFGFGILPLAAKEAAKFRAMSARDARNRGFYSGKADDLDHIPTMSFDGALRVGLHTLFLPYRNGNWTYENLLTAVSAAVGREVKLEEIKALELWPKKEGAIMQVNRAAVYLKGQENPVFLVVNVPKDIGPVLKQGQAIFSNRGIQRVPQDYWPIVSQQKASVSAVVWDSPVAMTLNEATVSPSNQRMYSEYFILDDIHDLIPDKAMAPYLLSTMYPALPADAAQEVQPLLNREPALKDPNGIPLYVTIGEWLEGYMETHIAPVLNGFRVRVIRHWGVNDRDYEDVELSPGESQEFWGEIARVRASGSRFKDGFVRTPVLAINDGPFVATLKEENGKNVVGRDSQGRPDIKLVSASGRVIYPEEFLPLQLAMDAVMYSPDPANPAAGRPVAWDNPRRAFQSFVQGYLDQMTSTGVQTKAEAIESALKILSKISQIRLTPEGYPLLPLEGGQSVPSPMHFPGVDAGGKNRILKAVANVPSFLDDFRRALSGPNENFLLTQVDSQDIRVKDEFVSRTSGERFVIDSITNKTGGTDEVSIRNLSTSASFQMQLQYMGAFLSDVELVSRTAMRSEHRPLLTDFSVQEPLVDLSVDREKLSAWIEAQEDPGAQKLFRFLAPHLTYMDFPAFKEGLRKSVESFQRNHQGDYAAVILGSLSEKPGPLSKSNPWVYRLARDLGLRAPKGEIASIQQYLSGKASEWLSQDENLNVNDLVYVDDAAYSGRQVQEFVSLIGLTLLDNAQGKFKDRTITVHLVIPAITRTAKEKLLSIAEKVNRGQTKERIKFEFYDQSPMRTVGEIFDQEQADAEIRNAFERLFPDQLDKPLTWIYKKPDFMSLPLAVGTGKTVLDGPVFNRDGKVDRYISFLPPVEDAAPYKAGYLEWIQKNIAGTEWASRIAPHALDSLNSLPESLRPRAESRQRRETIPYKGIPVEITAPTQEDFQYISASEGMLEEILDEAQHTLAWDLLRSPEFLDKIMELLGGEKPLQNLKLILSGSISANAGHNRVVMAFSARETSADGKQNWHDFMLKMSAPTAFGQAIDLRNYEKELEISERYKNNPVFQKYFARTYFVKSYTIPENIMERMIEKAGESWRGRIDDTIVFQLDEKREGNTLASQLEPSYEPKAEYILQEIVPALHAALEGWNALGIAFDLGRDDILISSNRKDISFIDAGFGQYLDLGLPGILSAFESMLEHANQAQSLHVTLETVVEQALEGMPADFKEQVRSVMPVRAENRDKSQLVHDQGMTLPETELRTLSQKYHISQSLLKKWAPFRVLPQMIPEKAPWGSYLNRLHAMDSTLLFVWKRGEGGAYEPEDEILSLVENDAALREFLWMTFENLKYGDKNSPNYVVWGITPDGRVLVQRVNQVDLERGESEDDFTYARRREQLDRGWFQSEISGDPDPEGHGLSRVRRIFPRSFLIRKLNNTSNPNKPWVVAEVTMAQRMPPNWKLRTFFFTAAAVLFTALGIFFWDLMSGPATPVNPDAGVEARVAVNFTALANYYTVFHLEQDLSPAGLLEWLDVYMDGPGIEAQLMGDNVRPALSVNPQHQMLQEDIRKKEGDNDYFRFVNGIRTALKEAKTQEAYEADPLLREFKKPKDILALIQSPAKTRQVYQDFLRRGIIKSTDGSKGSALLPERSENRDNLYTERGGAFLKSVSDISVAESIEEIKSLALRYRLRVMESPEAVKTKNDFYAGLTDGNKVEMVMLDTNGEKVSARWDVYPLKAETQYTISRLSPFYHIKEMLHIRSLAPENPWKKSSYPPGALRSLRYWAFYWPFIIDEEITKAIGFLFDAALYLFLEGTGMNRRSLLTGLRGQLKMLSNLESVKARMLTSLSPAESAQTWEGTRIIQEGGALRVQSDPTFWEFQYSDLSTLESAFKEAFPQEGLLGYIERRAREKASSGEVFTYVDWGAGNMNALAELAANLKQKGIQNVRLIGYSDQFFDEWGKLPENVEVIFDAYQNFPDYFRPGQKFDGVKADLIVSHIAMDHLRSKGDRRERDERPISIQDPYYLYLRDSIRPMLSADGILLDIALTPVGEGVYAPLAPDFEVSIRREGTGVDGIAALASQMMGIPKDSSKSPLVVFRPRAEVRQEIRSEKNLYNAAALLAMLSLTQLAAMPSVVMAQPEPGDIPPANSVKVKPVPAAPVPQEEKPASESEDVYIKDGKVYRRMIFTITPAKIIPHVYYIHVADTLGVSLFGDGLEAVRDKVMRSKNGGISIGLPYGNEELTIYDSGDLEWEKDGKSEKITLAHAKARMEKLQTLMMNDNTGRVTVTTRDASGTLRGKIDNLKEDAKDIAEREALRLKLDALDAADEAFKGGDAAGEQALEKAKNPSSFSIWMNTAVTMLRNAGVAPYILIALVIGLAGGIVYWIYSLRKTISKQAAGDAPQKPGIKTDAGDSGSGTRAENRSLIDQISDDARQGKSGSFDTVQAQIKTEAARILQGNDDGIFEQKVEPSVRLWAGNNVKRYAIRLADILKSVKDSFDLPGQMESQIVSDEELAFAEKIRGLVTLEILSRMAEKVMQEQEEDFQRDYSRAADVTAVRFFGSLIRNEVTPASDIDYVVEVKPGTSSSNRIDFENRFREAYQRYLRENGITNRVRAPYLAPSTSTISGIPVYIEGQAVEEVRVPFRAENRRAGRVPAISIATLLEQKGRLLMAKLFYHEFGNTLSNMGVVIRGLPATAPERMYESFEMLSDSISHITDFLNDVNSNGFFLTEAQGDDFIATFHTMSYGFLSAAGELRTPDIQFALDRNEKEILDRHIDSMKDISTVLLPLFKHLNDEIRVRLVPGTTEMAVDIAEVQRRYQTVEIATTALINGLRDTNLPAREILRDAVERHEIRSFSSLESAREALMQTKSQSYADFVKSYKKEGAKYRPDMWFRGLRDQGIEKAFETGEMRMLDGSGGPFAPSILTAALFGNGEEDYPRPNELGLIAAASFDKVQRRGVYKWGGPDAMQMAEADHLWLYQRDENDPKKIHLLEFKYQPVHSESRDSGTVETFGAQRSETRPSADALGQQTVSGTGRSETRGVQELAAQVMSFEKDYAAARKQWIAAQNEGNTAGLEEPEWNVWRQKEAYQEILKSAEALGLDTRPLQYGLLNPLFVGHAMETRRTINPDPKPDQIAIYGASGTDISKYLLTVGAPNAYFLEPVPIWTSKLEAALRGWKEDDSYDSNENYRMIYGAIGAGFEMHDAMDFKRTNGFASSGSYDFGEKESRIMVELKGMGVRKSSLKIGEEEREALLGGNSYKVPYVEFAWAQTAGGPENTYRIYFVPVDLTSPAQYPQILRDLEGKADIYFQEAAWDTAHDADFYLPAVAGLLKPNGILATDDRDVMSRFAGLTLSEHNPEPALQNFGIDFEKVEPSSAAQVWGALIQKHQAALARTPEIAENENYRRYGWDVTIRRIGKSGKFETQIPARKGWTAAEAMHQIFWAKKTEHPRDVNEIFDAAWTKVFDRLGVKGSSTVFVRGATKIAVAAAAASPKKVVLWAPDEASAQKKMQAIEQFQPYREAYAGKVEVLSDKSRKGFVKNTYSHAVVESQNPERLQKVLPLLKRKAVLLVPVKSLEVFSEEIAKIFDVEQGRQLTADDGRTFFQELKLTRIRSEARLESGTPRSEVRGDFLTSAFIRNSVTAAVMLSWSLGIPSELFAQKAPAAVKSEAAAEPKYEAAVRTVYGQMQAEGILPKASGVSVPGMKTSLSQEDIEEIAKVMAEMTGRDLRRQGIKVERGTNLKNVDRYSKIGTSENALARSLIKFWLGPENLRDLIQKIKKPEQYYAETLFGDEKAFLEGYRQVIADAKKNNQSEEEQINAYLNNHAETLYTMATAMNGLDEDKLTAPFQRGDATYFVREWARKLNAFAEAQSVQKRLALLEDREGIAPSTLTLGGILDFLSLYKDFNRTVDGQAREAFRRVIAEISARPAADAQKKRMLSLPVSSAKARADELSEGILRSSAINSILGDGELLQLVIEAYEANPQASREDFEALLKKNMDALAKLRTDRKLDAPKISFDLLRFQIEVPRGDDGFTEFIETLRASNGEKDKIVKAFESARLESLDKGSLSYERDRIQSILFQMRTAPAVPGVDGEKSYLQLKQELDHMLLTTRSGITLALLSKYPDLVQNLPRFNTIAAAEFEAGEFRDEYVRLFGYVPVNGYEPGPRHLVDFLMKNPQTLETEKIFERVTQMLQLPGIDWSSAEMTDSLEIKLVRDKGFFSPKTRAYLPFPEGGDAQEKRARIADFIKTLHTTAKDMKKAADEAKAAAEAKRKEKTKPKAPAVNPGGAKPAPGRSEMRSLLEEINARELNGIVSQIGGYADWLGERGDPLGEHLLGILRDPDLEPFLSMAQDLEERWKNLPKKEGEGWEEAIQFLHGFDLNHENLWGNAGHYLAQRQARVEFMLRLLDGGRVPNPKNFLRRYLMSWAGVTEPEMIEGLSPERRYSQHGIFGMLPSLFRISSISFSPDGEKLATVSQEGQIEIYNLRTGQTDLLDYLQGSQPTEEGARNPYPTSVRFSPDGKQLILGASDSSLRLRDLTTGEERILQDTPSQEGAPAAYFFTTPVRLTSDGRVFSLHSRGDIRTIQIRDGQTMAVQRNLTLPASSHFMQYTEPSFAVSPDGNFAAVTVAGQLVLYDLRGEFAEPVQVHLPAVAYQPPLAFSDDGRYLIAIPSPMVPEVVRYDLSTIQNGEVQPLSLFSSAYVNSFTATAFLGSRVLVGDAHGNLHLWDPETDTHRVILPLKAQGSETYRINRISDIAVRPDGTVAVTYQNGVGIFSPGKIDALSVPFSDELMLAELFGPRSENRETWEAMQDHARQIFERLDREGGKLLFEKTIRINDVPIKITGKQHDYVNFKLNPRTVQLETVASKQPGTGLIKVSVIADAPPDAPNYFAGYFAGNIEERTGTMSDALITFDPAIRGLGIGTQVYEEIGKALPPWIQTLKSDIVNFYSLREMAANAARIFTDWGREYQIGDLTSEIPQDTTPVMSKLRRALVKLLETSQDPRLHELVFTPRNLSQTQMGKLYHAAGFEDLRLSAENGRLILTGIRAETRDVNDAETAAIAESVITGKPLTLEQAGFTKSQVLSVNADAFFSALGESAKKAAGEKRTENLGVTQAQIDAAIDAIIRILKERFARGGKKTLAVAIDLENERVNLERVLSNPELQGLLSLVLVTKRTGELNVAGVNRQTINGLPKTAVFSADNGDAIPALTDRDSASAVSFGVGAVNKRPGQEALDVVGLLLEIASGLLVSDMEEVQTAADVKNPQKHDLLKAELIRQLFGSELQKQGDLKGAIRFTEQGISFDYSALKIMIQYLAEQAVSKAA